MIHLKQKIRIKLKITQNLNKIDQYAQHKIHKIVNQNIIKHEKIQIKKLLLMKKKKKTTKIKELKYQMTD